ncbi:GrpB family protein [Georgenia phoenicis]|uniref:GrpB family protein n=1 Tax=unclassified Georgenia TaxID=2626815 RepID=UPI0039AF9960
MDEERAVTLVPSRHEEWRLRYAELARRLSALLPAARLEHIGSTAVPDLPAKDVVDVLVGVDTADVVAVARRLRAEGLDLEGELAHHCWLSLPDRRSRTFVVHVVEHGGRAWARRIAFRDLLRSDADARERYLRVKRAAAREAAGWDDYTRAKSEVVAELLTRT